MKYFLIYLIKMKLEINQKGFILGATFSLFKELCSIYLENSGKELTQEQKEKLIKNINDEVITGAILGALPFPFQIPYVLSKLYITNSPKIHKLDYFGDW